MDIWPLREDHDIPARSHMAELLQALRLVPRVEDPPVIDVRRPETISPEAWNKRHPRPPRQPYPGGIVPFVEALGKGLTSSYPSQLARMLLRHGLGAQPGEIPPTDIPEDPEELRAAAAWITRYVNEGREQESFPEFMARGLGKALGGRGPLIDVLPLHRLLGLTPRIAGPLLGGPAAPMDTDAPPEPPHMVAQMRALTRSQAV